MSIETFASVYATELPKAHVANPEWYAFPASEIPAVVDRMKAAFHTGSFHHSGTAMAATCKALGIKHTRKAILEFFSKSS